MRINALVLSLATAALPALAQAAPSLVEATPAANAEVAKPTALTLTFSEDVDPALSGIDLVMTAMPGMAHHKPMPITGFPASVEGRAIKAALPRPLPTGTYVLTWHAAGSDRKGAKGSYTFKVR